MEDWNNTWNRRLLLNKISGEYNEVYFSKRKENIAVINIQIGKMWRRRRRPVPHQRHNVILNIVNIIIATVAAP